MLTGHIPVPYIVGVAAVVFICVAISRALAQDTEGLPPGPKPHWLFGNEIPQQYSWRYFAQLTEQYGGVFTIWQGRKPLVVVGTVDAADELMEKQAAFTADRPRQVVADEVRCSLLASLMWSKASCVADPLTEGATASRWLW